MVNFFSLLTARNLFLHIASTHTSILGREIVLGNSVFTAQALLLHTLHPTSNVRALRAWRDGKCHAARMLSFHRTAIRYGASAAPSRAASRTSAALDSRARECWASPHVPAPLCTGRAFEHLPLPHSQKRHAPPPRWPQCAWLSSFQPSLPMPAPP